MSSPRSFLRSSLVCAGVLVAAVAFLAGFHIAGSSDDAPSEGVVAGHVTSPPLRSGYWVVYEAGPFRDGLTALRYCDARGRTDRNSCMGRLLSLNAADITELCFRRDDGTYSNAC